MDVLLSNILVLGGASPVYGIILVQTTTVRVTLQKFEDVKWRGIVRGIFLDWLAYKRFYYLIVEAFYWCKVKGIFVGTCLDINVFSFYVGIMTS